MALTMKTVKGVVTLTWTTPTMEASWKVRPQMEEAEILDTLERVVRFVRTQNGEPTFPVRYPDAPGAPSAMTPGIPLPQPTPAPGPSTAPRVPMMPPASLSDRPSDGGRPGNQEFWESMPTLAVPEHLARESSGGWEMIPPGER